MYDLLVVGAGPYGLSIASHAAAAGLSLRVFGRPMASWRDRMPRGMFLESEPWASSLSDPEGRLRLDTYRAQQRAGARHGEPVPVEVFASYGLWFARHAVPEIDERTVTRVRPCLGGFEAVTEDGGAVRARTVALAIGFLPFTEVPAVLRELGSAHVSHSSDHGDLDRFRGTDVTMVADGGHAALETAALLAGQGTRVRVVARARDVRWNDVPPPPERPWWQSVHAPHSGLGRGWRNRFHAEHPGAFRRLPEATRTRIAGTAPGPAGGWWIRDRVESSVELLLGHEVTAAYATRGAVRLDLLSRTGGAQSLETEHVIVAAGFRATAGRLDPLAESLRGRLTVSSDGSPCLGREFEASWPGLFLAGPVTASAFGPAMRFVYGTSFTARTLVRGVRRRLRTGPVAVPVPGARERRAVLGTAGC